MKWKSIVNRSEWRGK